MYILTRRTNRGRIFQSIFVPSPTKFLVRVKVILSDRRHQTQGSRRRTDRTRNRPIVRGGNAPPRRGRRSRRRRSKRRSRSRTWSRRRRPTHKLQIQLFKERAVGGYVPRFLRTMANRTDTSARNSPIPTSLNPFQRTGREPLKGRTPLFTPPIDVCICSLGSRAPFPVRANQLELIMVAGIRVEGKQIL